MKISLRNIAKVKQADVEINGITVIAGANNTGKSTVGKALYAIFNGVSKIDEQVQEVRISNIVKAIIHSRFQRIDSLQLIKAIEHLAQNIIEDSCSKELSNEDLQDKIIKFHDSAEIVHTYSWGDKERLNELIDRIQDDLKISPALIKKILLERKFLAEFNQQVNSLYHNDEGTIELIVQEKSMSIKITNNAIAEYTNELDLYSQATYLDDPNILDTLSRLTIKESSLFDHRLALQFQLIKENSELSVIDEISVEQKLKIVYEKFENICIGNLKSEQANFYYQEKSKNIRVENLSTGLKTFIILKTLLQNGSIERKGTVILDEPEIHLHPEWQLIFAELLVLLQKTFNLHILLNTHSPYFLRAIQVYSAKHEIADKCKYYLSRVEDDGAYIDDVSDDIEQIYKSLVHPLQMLENEEWEING